MINRSTAFPALAACAVFMAPHAFAGHQTSTQSGSEGYAIQQGDAGPERPTGSGEEQFITVTERNHADEWPERFRSTDMPLELSDDQLRGLRELEIMGGGQLSEKQIKNIVERSDNPVVILDLRQEPHGYVAGVPITWFRPYISDRVLGTDAMISLENEFMDQLRSQPSVRVDNVEWTGGQEYEVLSSELLDSDAVMGNAEMVERNGARYVRYYIPVVPNDQQIAEFEELIAEISGQDVTLYFQCWDGTGRSTEFMVMYDILRNGRDVPLTTIADRHAAMGGINVLNLPPESSPNYSRSVMRRNFIIDYYKKRTDAE